MKLDQTSADNSYKYSWLAKRVFPYIKPVLGRLFIGFLVAVPLGLLDGVTAFALKPYLDYAVGQKDLVFTIMGTTYNISWQLFSFLIPFGVVLFAMVQGLLKYLNLYITEWTSKKITNSVKIDLFKTLIQQDTKFYDDNTTGMIQSRFLNDPQVASDSIVENLKTLTTSTFGALGLIAVMLYSSWKLAVVGVVVLCSAFIPVILIRNVIKKTSNQDMVINGNIRTYMNETCLGNRVVTSYQLQKRQDNLYEGEINHSFNVAMYAIKRAAWMSPIMYTIASCGIAAVLWYGTSLITSGQITVGSFASFVTSLLLLYKPVKNLGDTFTSLQKMFVAMSRVFELFDICPTIKDSENAEKFNGIENNITLENINFEYVENAPVLKNINLTINKNETIAIVGNSGGGKSTLINLLSRFYDVTGGAVKFDGVDIRNYTLESVRKNIAVVFQDNFLFTGTIRENIMMGNYDANEEQLEKAVQSAYLDEMLENMPDGLDTILGERGTTLSGGQRQRVAIARAMLKNAPIIVLDEATSALDNESEAIVQKAINNLMEEKTVFVIAHRLSTIKNAHRIAVLNEGELVELGTHDELMDIENGHYKKLYDMQFKQQEEMTTV